MYRLTACPHLKYRDLYNNPSYSRIWLILAYDLLEDRRTVDVIITKFFLCVLKCLKVLPENLDSILRDLANDKVQKSLAEGLNRLETQGQEI